MYNDTCADYTYLMLRCNFETRYLNFIHSTRENGTQY